MNQANDVADYDLFDYDYTTYWKNRSYENLAEKNILNNQFNGKRGNYLLDVGGSYGRLISTYYTEYSHPIVLDYSLKTLQKNRDIILSKYPNVELIAGNAYKMPFRDNTFDAALMVRVLHHIEKPTDYYKELQRVMVNNSTYIQEFANKIHIKASLKAIATLSFKFFSKVPYEHPLTNNNAEGTKEGLKGIFYNYHPSDIKEKLEKNGFKITKKIGCSFLRIPFLKKIINENIMLSIEKIFQTTLSWTNIPPSIFYITKLSKKETTTKTVPQTNLEEILVCPCCKGKLTFHNNTEAICKKCEKKYYKKENIWDFREI